MESVKTEKNQASVLTPEILTVLHGLNEHYHKAYCFPSQKKILELLENRLKVKRSRATLNRHLKIMERKGLISRTRRTRRDPVMGIIFQSTLYHILLNGYQFLLRLGLRVYKQISIVRNMLNKTMEKIKPGPEKEKRKGDLTPIKDILGGIKKLGFT